MRAPARGRATTTAWRRSPASCSTGALPRTGRPTTRRARSSSTTSKEREEKTVRRRRRRLRALGRRREAAGLEEGRLRHRRAQAGPEAGEEDRDAAASRRRSTRSPSGGRSSTTPGGCERDYFYDPGMHGVDWNEMRQRYGKLLEDAVTRWDVNFVHRRADRGAQLVAHLPQRRRRRGRPPKRGVGLLGRRLRARERRLPHQAHPRRRAVGQRGALAARPAGRRTSRRATTCWRSTGRAARRRARTRGPRSRAWPSKPVLLTVNDKPTMAGRARGAGPDARRRGPAAQPGLDRGEAPQGGRGDAAGASATSTCPTPGSNGQNELVRLFRGQVTEGRA